MQLRLQRCGDAHELPDCTSNRQPAEELAPFGTPCAGWHAEDLPMLPGATPTACSRAAGEAPSHAGGAHALRQELVALREEERALRRLERRRRSKDYPEAGLGDNDVVKDSIRGAGDREVAACAALREAFRSAEERECALREEFHTAEK